MRKQKRVTNINVFSVLYNQFEVDLKKIKT